MMVRATRTLSLVAIGACQSAFAAAQPPVPREPLPLVRFREGQSAFSTYSGLIDSLRLVVRDSTAWRLLWQRINRPFFPPPALPPVDFHREMVVVAALGTRPSAGFDVVIEGATEDSAGIEVEVRRTNPSTGCPVAAAITQPVDLAKIPVSGRALRFRERSTLMSCVAP
jgi:protease stability complex PrcB-like protein